MPIKLQTHTGTEDIEEEETNFVLEETKGCWKKIKRTYLTWNINRDDTKSSTWDYLAWWKTKEQSQVESVPCGGNAIRQKSSWWHCEVSVEETGKWTNVRIWITLKGLKMWLLDDWVWAFLKRQASCSGWHIPKNGQDTINTAMGAHWCK